MWEFKFKSECEECLSRLIFKLKLICVLVHFKNLKNLGYYVKISFLSLSFVQGCEHIGWNNVVLTKVLVSPFSDVLNKCTFGLFKSVMFTWKSEWSKFISCILSSDFLESWFLIRWEESPWTVVENVGIELSLVIVESNCGSVNSDNISKSVDNG